MNTHYNDSRVGEQQFAASSAFTGDDHRHSQETSHVFYCMQCDLQFQTDVAIVSQDGSHENEEEKVRVRLDPHTSLQQDAENILPRIIEREVDRAMHEGEEEASC
jgi:hypothetical protein